MSIPYRNVHVVINPAAGKDDAILNKINRVFHEHGVSWTAEVTQAAGDATRMTREAVAAGVDLVAGYGGDGTQMEIANGVFGSDTPMAILPGGTGNAMSMELGVSRDLTQAAELICRSHKVRAVDMAESGERHFILRAYTGLAEGEEASREMKDRFGNLAYVGTALKSLRNLPNINYRLTIDGTVVEATGFTCLVLNAGSMGGVDIVHTTNISIDDGLLDVFIVSKSRAALGSIASYELNVGRRKAQASRWRAKEITIQAEPAQVLWLDGEASGETPATIRVVPHAVKIVVP